MEKKYDYTGYDIDKKPDHAGILKAYADRIIAMANEEKENNKTEEE